jgi:hypothetical protein
MPTLTRNGSNGLILAGHIGPASRRHLLSSLLTKTAACDLLIYAKYFTSSCGHAITRSDDIQGREHRVRLYYICIR